MPRLPGMYGANRFSPADDKKRERMSRILVTGGSGFIGTNLVEFFAGRGDAVLSLDIQPPRNAAHRPVWRGVDVLDASRLRGAISEFRPEVILHMAARTDLRGKSAADYPANTEGVKNVLEAAKDLPQLRRLVLASSRLVCRIGYMPRDEFDCCPTTAYGESKVAGERIVRAFEGLQCPWVMVRPTSLWGPWFDVPYKTFFTAIRRGLYVHPRGRKIRKSFGFVGNSVYEIEKLVSCSAALVHGKTLYLADYPPLEVRQWAELIRGEMGARPILDVPLWALGFLAKAGDAAKAFGMAEPPLTSFRLDNLLCEMVHDLGPMEAICGKLPCSVEQGVRKTVEWMNGHPG